MEKEGEREEEVEREALPSLYIFQRSDRQFSVKQEEKSFLGTRAASGDKK